jgi:hypothetical protein
MDTRSTTLTSLRTREAAVVVSKAKKQLLV